MKKYYTELFLFFLSLAAAYFIGWNNTDLLWSFWITSLVVGYVSIFRSSVAPLNLFFKKNQISEGVKKFRKLSSPKKLEAVFFILIFVPFILFFIIFLSLHFFIFHLFLAYFLQVGFPHSGLADIFEDATGGQLYISIHIIKTLLISYWIIVLEKLIIDYRTNRKSGSQIRPTQRSTTDEFFSFEGIKRPYVQVARIHISILLLLLLNAIDSNQYLVYVVIYSIFFFPIAAIRKVRS